MILRRNVAAPAALALVLGVSLPGQDAHEVIRQKPFQRATLSEGWGEVELPVTSVREETQKFFNQGVAQLHTHSYFEAERSFRQVVFTEPDCAMGYWGMAMANIHNPDRAAMFLDRAVLHRDRTTAVERLFLDALLRYYETTPEGARIRNKALAEQKGWPVVPERRFSAPRSARAERLARDYSALVAAHPDNLDGLAFFADQQIRELPGDAPAAELEKVDAILHSLLQRNRRHPAHFYRLKLWASRDPARAEGSMTFAMVASPASRGIWHLTGRVQARMGKFRAAATYFEAAARVDHARMAPYRSMPFDVYGYGRNLGQLCESLTQLGHGKDALAFARYMLALRRHPKRNQLSDPDSIAHRGAIELARVAKAWGLALGDVLRGMDPKAQAIAKQFAAADQAPAGRPRADGAPSLARAVRRLYDGGDRAGAKRAFERLRVAAGTADLDLPVLRGLAAVAKEFGWPADWRKPPERPPALWPVEDLAQLGPRYWKPWVPRGFELTSREGPVVRYKDLRGRAHVLVFFIGNGCCLTCVAQLHLFNAAAEDYKAEDIDIAAISFHSAADVRASMKKMGDQGFPFRLLADPKMRTWYEWLTVDGHDHAPLHGTFLLDEQGRVRWKQIADHPFEDAQWLLKESRRLLGREGPRSVR